MREIVLKIYIFLHDSGKLTLSLVKINDTNNVIIKEYIVEAKIKNMNAHKIEVILIEDGTLTLRGLPFHGGEAVEVIILEAKNSQQQIAIKPQSYKNIYPLQNTQLYSYEEPTEPIALEDWEVLFYNDCNNKKLD